VEGKKHEGKVQSDVRCKTLKIMSLWSISERKGDRRSNHQERKNRLSTTEESLPTDIEAEKYKRIGGMRKQGNVDYEGNEK